MCFAFDAHPPDLPADLALPTLAGGAAAELLELTSADGTRFSAALAEAPEGRGPGVVILPDVRGLYRFYVELAERFAQAGHHAIAIDYFGRTAGTGERDNDWDYMPHVMQTRVGAGPGRRRRRDRGAARAHGRELDRHRRVLLRRHAVVHGRHQRRARPRRRRRLLRRPRAPARGRPGADRARRRDALPDPRALRRRRRGHPPRAHRGLRARAREAGVEHEIVTYPGAPHSFFDRSFSEHAEACEDAWRRVLGFLQNVGAAVAA